MLSDDYFARLQTDADELNSLLDQYMILRTALASALVVLGQYPQGLDALRGLLLIGMERAPQGSEVQSLYQSVLEDLESGAMLREDYALL